mmetsp:Transcript_6261/g.12488  ORF Transcript_6261/g.12488 Transcript_6261/m.12488 type:complete len:251 (+) Transcript_6261:360-1112(+)
MLVNRRRTKLSMAFIWSSMFGCRLRLFCRLTISSSASASSFVSLARLGGSMSSAVRSDRLVMVLSRETELTFDSVDRSLSGASCSPKLFSSALFRSVWGCCGVFLARRRLRLRVGTELRRFTVMTSGRTFVFFFRPLRFFASSFLKFSASSPDPPSPPAPDWSLGRSLSDRFLSDTLVKLLISMSGPFDLAGVLNRRALRCSTILDFISSSRRRRSARRFLRSASSWDEVKSLRNAMKVVKKSSRLMSGS